ncbi:hypothetical protein ACYCS5_26900 [Paenibacillus sp. SEL3]
MKYDVSAPDGVRYTSGRQSDKAVKRERYSRMIGYDFGGWVYKGAAYDEGCRQYLFQHNETGEMWVTDYKGFREHIDKYDFPSGK